jgi:hypothetical protein
MTFNPLPPQAYTKETLLKAYQWLMGQNSSLKEIATTPDILVSLYLKATRDGEHSLERPSIQNFKNELRSLAGLMGELDRPAVTPQVMHQQQQVHHQAPPQTMHYQAPAQPMEAPVHMMPPQAAHVIQQPQYHAQAQVHTHIQSKPASTAAPQGTTHQVSYTEKTLTATTQTPDMLEILDCGTRAMIQEVKDEFNLSSELEALRMLVKIGYSRSKGMLA